MRIRTIKPKFWRSDDITQLSIPDRLLFIGLWSYVDDNGVGLDDARAITADLFAYEPDPRETLAYVRDGLATLARFRRITRYGSPDQPLIHVTNWDRHQRIDRPGKPRYPVPSTSEILAAERSTRESASTCPAISPFGRGEVEEERTEPLRGSARDPRESLASTGKQPTESKRAQTITDAYVDRVPLSNYPAIFGIVRKALRCKRYADDAVMSALLRLADDGRSVTVETLRTELDGLPAARSRPSTTDQRVADAQALKIKMRAKREIQ